MVSRFQVKHLINVNIWGLKLKAVATNKQVTKLGILSIRFDNTGAIIDAGTKPTTMVRVNKEISAVDSSKK